MKFASLRMTNFIIVLPALILTACATDITAVHTHCMGSYADFANEVACVKNAVSADPSLKGDTLVQEYVLGGENLVKQVQTGTMTGDEARLNFTNRLNDIQQRQADLLAQQARASRAADFNRPHFTNCRRAGNEVQCTSY